MWSSTKQIHVSSGMYQDTIFGHSTIIVTNAICNVHICCGFFLCFRILVRDGSFLFVDIIIDILYKHSFYNENKYFHSSSTRLTFFIQFFNWMSYLSLKRTFERGCRWFQLFFSFFIKMILGCFCTLNIQKVKVNTRNLGE